MQWDIVVVEALQNAGVKHRYGVVDEQAIGTALHTARAILRGVEGMSGKW
jgi:hypothetical protein